MSSSDSDESFDRIDLEQISDTRLGELFPRLHSMPTRGPELSQIPTVVRHRVRENVPLDWSALAELRIGEILSWRNTGVSKARALLSFLAESVESTSRPGPDQEANREDRHRRTGEIIEALVELSAWGANQGSGTLVDALAAARDSDAPDLPRESLAVLSIDPSEFAGPERVAVYDATEALRRIFDSLSDRQRQIFEERILIRSSRAPTLEELGRSFSVTRERVRQIERSAMERIASLSHERGNAPAIRRARDLVDELGTAFPLEELGVDSVDDLEFEMKLLLHLAGPYRPDRSWLVSDPWESVVQIVELSFDAVAERGIAEVEAVRSALMGNGLRERFVEEAIERTGRVQLLGSVIVRWGNTYRDKAEAVLRVGRRPMRSEEIYAFLDDRGSISGFRNAIQSDPSIVRVGKDLYGLAEWGGIEYSGVVPAMREELESRGSVPLDELASVLAERHGVSPNSITMNAHIHPAFKTEAGRVMLRPDDEPYVPDSDLVSAPGCWVVDGAWSLAVEVDEDVLRGSGTGIPEAFAVHIGISPGASKSLGSDHGEIHVGWGQTPALGSVRLAAEELNGSLGDVLWVRCPNPFWLGFRITKPPDEGLEPRERLMALLALDEFPDSWQVAVARALGLDGDESDDALVRILRRKGATEIVAAVEEIRESP